MTWQSVFPTVIAVLDVAAAVVYASKGSWWLAITWGCYAVASFTLGQVK